MPLESALQAIARSRGLDVACLGSVVYVGPPAAVENLGAIAAALETSVRRLPSAARRKYHQTQRLAWEDLASPRELLADLARDSGLEIAGLELVPHDLWAAADLPPMSLTDRLALIAVQFDLALKVAAGGRRLELVPLSEAIRRSGAAGSRSRPKPATSAKAKPPTTIEQTRIDKISVVGKATGPRSQAACRPTWPGTADRPTGHRRGGDFSRPTGVAAYRERHGQRASSPASQIHSPDVPPPRPRRGNHARRIAASFSRWSSKQRALLLRETGDWASAQEIVS